MLDEIVKAIDALSITIALGHLGISVILTAIFLRGGSK